MIANAVVPVDEAALLEAAQGGDDDAFARLVEPHRRALHVHCYRMLGSLHDADDALQDTLVRAWRSLGRYEHRAPLRAWLYRIATNASLRALERRARAPEALDLDEAEVAAYFQPYPDRLLEPEIATEERESIGLAFVAAMQFLPPRQRAVLVLRDVLGWTALETADLLGDSVASVNSALRRARKRLEHERAAGWLARDHAPASAEVEARAMRRFVEAWDAADVDGIVALLSDDAVMTMPPDPVRIGGAQAIGDFFRTVPAQGDLEQIRLLPARANGQPALAAYLVGEGEAFEAYGVMIFALQGEEVASITGFAGHPELFPELGLPRRLGRRGPL
jgi:RNA polymerase sigma-70 factor (ECF subfamily)